ncbi:hypothetical protein [Rhizobium sp. NFR03]|uniref:hypothetical protein n=1 Tax=Rhizobium sp. NFR03 TaxID=1566263 RepID=UPI0008CA7AC8|nr:hypothetical protein [Rhizobium sp. NFR03]SER56933.1 hypothetical protein SAMN03159406_00508 [Rhizobium sp. NFR03]
MATQIRRIAFATFVAFSLLALPSAAAERLFPVSQDLQKGSTNGVELIADNQFETGFSATPACNSPEEKECADNTRYVLKSPAFPNMADVKPVWDLRQWGSRSTFGAVPIKYGEGYAWITPDKRLVVYPGGRIEMAVSGESEFGGQYRNEQPSKPSLIAGQNIAAPGLYHRDTGSLSGMSKLVFNVDFKKDYDDQNRKHGYDPNRNAMIFPVNFTVQNLKDGSEGYGQFVWLQINPYDDRNEVAVSKQDQEMTDMGTSMSIYFVPTSSLTSGNAHSGEWVNFRGDILPYAIRSIEIAYRKGLLKSNDISDYKIGGLNIGYELSGLNIATLQIRNLSLKMFSKK